MHSSTQDGGDSASVHSAQGANNTPTIVETVQEGGSEDSLEEHQDSQEVVNLGDAVRVDLHNDADSGYDSGLQDLVVNADDPGQANFVMSVGALGNAGGTPLDGSHDMSFGESTVDEEFTIDGEDSASIMAAYSIPLTYNQNDLNVDDSTIVDPEVIGELMSWRSVVDPQSPTSTVQFNEQVAVQHCVIGSPTSTSGTNAIASAENTVGAEPSDSTQGDPVSTQGGPPPSQGGPPPSQPAGDANAGNSPSSTGSNGNGGNQGGTNSGNGPQGPTPDSNYLDKLVFVCSTAGGPLQHWGIEGRLRAGSVFQLMGPDDNLRLRSFRMLVRPDFVERIMHNMHFVYQHNNRGRVRAIIDGMSLFMLSLPNATLMPGNLTVLEDHTQSSDEICRLLVQHLKCADTLAPEQLPLEVPLLPFSERMHTHQHAVTGSFECVKKVNGANVIEIPHCTTLKATGLLSCL